MSSRFEFLGNIALGQYIPRDSWFHKRDPRARVISFLILFTAIIFASGFIGLFIGLLAVVIQYIAAKLPIKNTWPGIKRALPFILILALLQIIFYQPANNEVVLVEVLGTAITQTGIIRALNLVVRFLGLIILLNAFVMSISTSQVSSALFYLLKPFEKFGFPVNDLTMVVQITMRYLPLIAQMAEKTAKAQAARGADWEVSGFNPIKQAKRVIPLIVPLIVNSLKRAETMAIAMESRGFYAGHQRSSYYVLHFRWEDSILILISLIIGVMALLVGKIL